ncbi:MAG: class II aldolase/adducin family protein [Anaerolineae bacterium]
MQAKNELELKQQMVDVAHILAESGLISSSDGNISVKVERDRFLATPSGLYKRTMGVDDIIVVDVDGEFLEGRSGLQPTSEIKMHMEVYRQRADVEAVLHAHPPYAVALTIAEIPFPVHLIPEVLLALGDVPTAEYATPGTQDLAWSIRALVRDHDAMLLSHHGSLTVGKTLTEALIALERLEAAARTYYLAHGLGTPVPLPEVELERLRALRRRMSETQ